MIAPPTGYSPAKAEANAANSTVIEMIGQACAAPLPSTKRCEYSSEPSAIFAPMARPDRRGFRRADTSRRCDFATRSGNAQISIGVLAGGALRQIKPSHSVVICLKPKQGGGIMPTGLFRTTDQSAQVEYDGVSIPIPRSRYEKNGYKPDFDKLPLEEEYRAAKEKLDNAKDGPFTF